MALLNDYQKAARSMADWDSPPEGHRLFHTHGVIGTPHLGYVTEEKFRIFYTGAVQDIAGWVAGAPVSVLN